MKEKKKMKVIKALGFISKIGIMCVAIVCNIILNIATLFVSAIVKQEE